MEIGLGPNDWILLDSCRQVLAPFAKLVSHYTKNENYATLSTVYPFVFGLLHKMRAVSLLFLYRFIEF